MGSTYFCSKARYPQRPLVRRHDALRKHQGVHWDEFESSPDDIMCVNATGNLTNRPHRRHLSPREFLMKGGW